MEESLVSILIPVYNREDIIAESVNSAINQTYKNIEVIVVDNCSTDKTWDILTELASRDIRIKIFRNSLNLGPVLNWNECIQRARGEYVKILWSDDWMSLDFLEKSVPLFDIDTAFVLSGYSITDGVECHNFCFKEEYDTEEYLKEILFFNKSEFPVSPGAAIFRKNDIVENFYCSNIPNADNLSSIRNGAGNDLLIFLLIANSYKKIRTTTSIDNFFRKHPESISIKETDTIWLFYLWSKLYFLRLERKQGIENLFKAFLLHSNRNKRNEYLTNIIMSSRFKFVSISNLFETGLFVMKFIVIQNVKDKVRHILHLSKKVGISKTNRQKKVSRHI